MVPEISSPVLGKDGSTTLNSAFWRREGIYWGGIDGCHLAFGKKGRGESRRFLLTTTVEKKAVGKRSGGISSQRDRHSFLMKKEVAATLINSLACRGGGEGGERPALTNTIT